MMTFSNPFTVMLRARSWSMESGEMSVS